MRKEGSNFNTKCISEAGSFKKNRDFTGFINLDNYACWVVVDGIDASDEKLSAEIAASSIIEDFTINPGFSKGLIKKYIENANVLLTEFTGKTSLSASVMVIISDYKNLMYAYAGNTRFYHLRKDKIINKTKDHSISRLMVDVGDLDKNLIDQHKYRNTLYNYLGKENKVKTDISKKIKLLPDDVLLIGSIGMWENLEEKEIGDVLKGSMNGEEFAENIEYLIKENDIKNLNNYSIMTIFAEKLFDKVEAKKKFDAENPPKKVSFAFLKNKIFKRVILALLLVLVATGAFMIKKQMAKTETQKQEQQEVKEEVKQADKLLEGGNLDESLSNFEEAREKYKDDPEKLKEIDGKIRKIKATMSAAEFEKQGDKSFESKNYEGAIAQYTSAVVLLNTEKAGDVTGLQDKIDKAKELTKILSLEKSADDALAKQDYDGALKIYQSLVATTSPDKYADVIARIKEKSETINEISSAHDLEVSALALYKKGKYEQAKNKYQSALSIYDGAGIAQKKKEIKDTISEIEELQAYEDTMAEGQTLEDAGDNELDKKNYDKAQSKYEAAQAKYAAIESQKEVTEVTKKIDGIDYLKKYDIGKAFEAEGDNQFASKKYKKSIENYEKAKGVFNDLNKPEEYNAMNEKIKIAKKKDKILGIF